MMSDSRDNKKAEISQLTYYQLFLLEKNIAYSLHNLK